ncbi:MAG: ABC transporter permease, partial [bacterium]|nr:ABC transporter permease [bacterium]
TLSVGFGAREKSLVSIEKIGSRLILIFPGKISGMAQMGEAGIEMEKDDVKAIAAVAGVEEVVPQVGTNVEAGYKNLETDTFIFGVTSNFPKVRDYSMNRGRFFTENEDLTGKRVCVLGYKVAEKLFKYENPIGKSITVRGLKGEGVFKVIGVLNPKGQNITVDQDDRFYAPITSVQEDILKKSEISVVYVRIKKNQSTEEMIKRIQYALRKKYGDRAEYFSVKSQEEIMGLLGTISNVFTALIASIAGLALLVGGVGIMNIMLVTVNERRKEIGIRKAVGATYKNILLQFISEAILLANLGSFSGVILGVILSGFISVAAGWKLIVSIPMIILAILVANLIGVFFGIYPARKAAMLNPMETLREL